MPKINRNFEEQVVGRTAETTGERWISVRQNMNTAWAPRSAFTGNGATAIALLSRQGVDIIGRDHVAYIQASVAAVKDFPPGDLVTNVGWNGPHFALQDGTVLSPAGKRPFAVTLDPIPGKNDLGGRMDRWVKRVASLLVGQPLAMFCLMLSFVGPIMALTRRSDNFGFELVGDKGIGKSTLQRLMASVWGGIGAGVGGRYFETFDTTLNALEVQLRAHADCLLILDEAALFFAGSSDRQRAGLFQAFAFKMATGDEKGRLGASRARGIRLTYLSSSNEPLEQIIGTKSVTAGAAGDRLISIPIPQRPYGVFESLPAGCTSSGELARQLMSSAARHHGHAIRVFVQALVDHRVSDEPALRNRIEELVDLFRRKAGVDPNSGTQMRVAEAFGLVFAAGQLAKEYGALPVGFQGIGPAVLTVYRTYLVGSLQPRPFLDRLLDVAGRADTVGLCGKRKPIARHRLRKIVAFTVLKDDHQELLLTRKSFARLFPDHEALLRQREVRELMKRDGRSLMPWRTLAEGVDQRVHVFRLPLPVENEN